MFDIHCNWDQKKEPLDPFWVHLAYIQDVEIVCKWRVEGCTWTLEHVEYNNQIILCVFNNFVACVFVAALYN
jgi:hypothetical protein